MRQTRKQFTWQLIRQAIAMHEGGKKWADIALAFGCTEGSLKKTVCSFRQGEWGAGERFEAERQHIEILVKEGLRPYQIADRMGFKRPAILTRLRAMGLDPEMRAELQRAA